MNGELFDSAAEARISIADHGFVVGDGVFEVAAIRDNVPFALTRHLARLQVSAQGLGIGTVDVDYVRAGLQASLAAGDWSLAKARFTVTSGTGPLGSPRGTGELTYVVAVEAMPHAPPTSAVVTVPWVRNERSAVAGLKTTSYAENALMVEYAKQRGATEAIMANSKGELCEGTGSNIFWVLGDVIHTPTLESGCLAGITRGLALQWLSAELKVVETDAPLDVLFEAEEVFLTSTTRDIQAVDRVNDQVIDAPGPVTRQAQQIWARETARTSDP